MILFSAAELFLTMNKILNCIFETIADFLYPPKCPVCEKYIEERSKILCEECTKKILAVGIFHDKRPPLKKIWRLTRYKEGTRGMIRDLKFNDKLNQLNAIKMILNKAVTASPELIKFLKMIDISTAVPLHIKREKERGFNQVELIFNDWLKMQNIPMEKLLLRIKDTNHLFDMNPSERQKELEEAFSLVEGVKEKIKNKKILILDDIFTTGTTMSKCAEVLKSNGADEIFGLALAADFKYSS